MSTTILLIITPAFLLVCVMALLWGALVRSQKRRNVNIRDASLSNEELEAHAKSIAIHHAVTSRKNYVTLPIPRMNDSYNLILATYMKLNQDVQKRRVVPQAAEWLLDNFYMVEEQVKVLDSRNCAGGIYFLIQHAQELIRQGCSLNEVMAALIAERKQIRNVFTVNDMTNLRKSGRLGVVRQSVSTILNLRPILCLQNGSVFSQSVARGNHEQTRMLVESVPIGTKFVVIHGRESNPLLPTLQTMLRERLGDELELRIVSLGPVLTIHLGLTYLGVCWLDDENVTNVKCADAEGNDGSDRESPQA